MWGLIATAVSGLNAGAGLQTILVDQPAFPSTATTTADPLFLEAYWNMLHKITEKKIASTSTMATIAASASLTAYFMASGESEARADPAWITCALLSGAIPLYNLLLLSPQYISNIRLAVGQTEKISWINSFKNRELGGICLGAAAFTCCLLVLASRSGEQELSANPFRLWS